MIFVITLHIYNNSPPLGNLLNSQPTKYCYRYSSLYYIYVIIVLQRPIKSIIILQHFRSIRYNKTKFQFKPNGFFYIMVSFLGHHGTDSSSANNILNSNFNISVGNTEWLGDGVYFFVEGLNSDTTTLAAKWAECQAWDNTSKTHKYKNYSVIESQIQVEEEKFLDLTVEEGVEDLGYLAEKYIEKIKSIEKKLSFYDGFLLNLARNEKVFPLEAVKGNFYIKFEQERIYRINLRTSNCTICSVYDPNKLLSNNSIIKTGKIL